MGKRKCIGILYTVYKDWIGGIYYIQNLISALCLLPDKDKPIIDVFTKEIDDFNELCSITNYPYLVFNGEYRTVWHKVKIQHLLHCFGLLRKYPVDVYNLRRRDVFLFPVLYESTRKGLFWMPDFQSERLPEFFSVEEIEARRESIRGNAYLNRPIVLSSKDCLNDYNKFFPDYHNKTFVLNFAVTLPDYSQVCISDLKEKYNITTKKYLFCANQFWAHKNHLYLFSEFWEYVKKRNDISLVCTGDLVETRDKDYINKVKSVLNNDVLREHVKILGLIPRLEMLCLMKHAEAVIQPSLFEGWSTVVEDAKATGKFVFLSDIPVHREQLKQNVCFFDPHEPGDLVRKLMTTTIKTEFLDYTLCRKQFAETFLHIIKDYSK